MESVQENRDRGKSGCMKKFVITVVVSVAGLLGLWLYFYPTYSWHQKMTVEVDVDGETYVGSSVVEMHVSAYPDTGWAPGVRSYGVRGEAVVVELPEKRYLFTLLTYNVFLTGKVFHDIVGGDVSEPEKGWARVIGDVQEVRDLDPKDYPLLATFTNLNDSTTVKVLDPANLEATFGSGVSLKRITLEITDEPVTEGRVERVLSWFYEVENLFPIGQKPFAVKDQTPGQRLHLGDFIDGQTKTARREQRKAQGK